MKKKNENACAKIKFMGGEEKVFESPHDWGSWPKVHVCPKKRVRWTKNVQKYVHVVYRCPL